MNPMTPMNPIPITNVDMVKLGLMAGGLGRAASMGLGGAALGALLTGKKEHDEATEDYALRLLRNVSMGGLGGAAAPSLLKRVPAAAKAIGRGLAATGRALLGREMTIPGRAGAMLAGGGLGGLASVATGDTENLPRNIALGVMAGGVAPTMMRAGRWAASRLAGKPYAQKLVDAANRLDKLRSGMRLPPTVAEAKKLDVAVKRMRELLARGGRRAPSPQLLGNIGALLGAGGAGAAGIGAARALNAREYE